MALIYKQKNISLLQDVDSVFDKTSSNPIENKVVANAISNIEDRGYIISKRLDNTSLNNITNNGVYFVSGNTCTELPITSSGYLHVISHDTDTTLWVMQLFVGGTWNVGEAFIRCCYNGTWKDWNKIYTTGSKPTASDVGALPITGGTLTGGLVVPELRARATDNTNDIVIGVGENDVYVHNKNAGTYLQLGSDGNVAFNNQPLYHTGNKPTASDVGAIPRDGATNPTIHVAGIEYTLYHTGNKPTASDIGAIATSNCPIVEKSVSLSAPWSGTVYFARVGLIKCIYMDTITTTSSGASTTICSIPNDYYPSHNTVSFFGYASSHTNKITRFKVQPYGRLEIEGSPASGEVLCANIVYV